MEKLYDRQRAFYTFYEKLFKPLKNALVVSITLVVPSVKMVIFDKRESSVS